MQSANTILTHKMPFGSNCPAITRDRWTKHSAGIAIRDEVRPLILMENARRLTDLSAASMAAAARHLHRGTPLR